MRGRASEAVVPLPAASWPGRIQQLQLGTTSVRGEELQGVAAEQREHWLSWEWEVLQRQREEVCAFMVSYLRHRKLAESGDCLKLLLPCLLLGGLQMAKRRYKAGALHLDGSRNVGHPLYNLSLATLQLSLRISNVFEW